MNTTMFAGNYQNLKHSRKNDVIRTLSGGIHLFLGLSSRFAYEKPLYYDCLNLSNNSINSFYGEVSVTKLGNIDGTLAELLNLNQ